MDENTIIADTAVEETTKEVPMKASAGKTYVTRVDSLKIRDELGATLSEVDCGTMLEPASGKTIKGQTCIKHAGIIGYVDKSSIK